MWRFMSDLLELQRLQGDGGSRTVERIGIVGSGGFVLTGTDQKAKCKSYYHTPQELAAHTPARSWQRQVT